MKNMIKIKMIKNKQKIILIKKNNRINLFILNFLAKSIKKSSN